MSKRNLGEKIKLQSYGDMFGEETENEVVVSEQIKYVALTELHTFKNHPFKVSDDEKMEEMVESVKQYGILVPAIARERAEGGYELISGHRRHHAATLAGLETMPVMIKDCSDDEATVIMVDANIQREDISISEKAKAYRMKYDAMKHQGATGGIIMKLFNPHIEALFSYELPEDFKLEPGEYFQFLDESFNGNLDELKETFRWSNAYLWLLDTLRNNDGCMYFGELSTALHDAVVSDPKPYRKDIKQMLSNLLRLIEELKMEEIAIDRPNYSQRIQLISM